MVHSLTPRVAPPPSHPTRRAFLAALFILPAASPWAAELGPTDAESAIKRLQQVWRDSLAEKLKGSANFPYLEKQINERNRLSARKAEGAEAASRVERALGPLAKRGLIKVGTLDELKRAKTLWAVQNPGDFRSGFEAFLDATTGDLIFLWIIPEG